MNESGDYVNRSNPMNVTLSSGVSAKAITAAGTDQMVKIERDGYMISWDMLNLQTSIADQISTTQMNPISALTISDDDDKNNIDLGGVRLNEMADACVDKLDSGVIYSSVYNDVDIDIDIMPTAVKETIILNSAESAPEQFAYYIMTDGLAAELQEDNSIIFINDSSEVIFTIPAMYMFDSSENAENNYDIETSIEPFKAGYLLTITPDSEWLASDERVYPVMIDPEVIEDSGNVSDSYIDESDPDTNFSNQYLKMGGNYSDGTRTETFIRYQSDFSSFHYSVDILEAKLVLYFLENNQSGSTLLCDNNINALSRSGNYEGSPETRFYAITKDTYIYHSYHGDGMADECTGTPYYQLKEE